MKRVLALVVLFFGLFLSRSALATHFHGNTVTWRVTDPQGAPNTVVFTITSAWTNADSSGTGFALDFGDGQSAPIPVGAAIGPSIEVVTGATVLHEQATLSHTYAGPGVYTAKASTCCRPTTINSGVCSTHSATAPPSSASCTPTLAGPASPMPRRPSRPTSCAPTTSPPR